MKKQFRRLSCVFLFATLVITGFAWMGGARTALAITPITLCYVDISVLVSGSGTSWGDPYKYLQDALADATCQEILVAKGIYYPDEGTGQTNDQRTSTFLLKNRVAIYGGYPLAEEAHVTGSPTLPSLAATWTKMTPH